MEGKMEDEEKIQRASLTERMNAAGLSRPKKYNEVYDLYSDYRLKINEFSEDVELDLGHNEAYFQAGFSGLSNVSGYLDRFTRLHVEYKRSLDAKRSRAYNAYRIGRNVVLSQLGREPIKTPTLDDLIGESIDILAKLREELAPTHEAVIEIARGVAAYNDETLIRLINAGRYSNELQAIRKGYESLHREVLQERRKVRVTDEDYEIFQMAEVNLERITGYWKDQGVSTEGTVNFSHPEAKVIRNYERLCQSTIHYCERVVEYTNAVERHFKRTMGVGTIIKATRTNIAAVEQIAGPLTNYVLDNVKVVGEAVADMAKIAARPEIDGELTKMMDPVLEGFVSTVRKITGSREAQTSAMARKILYTPGY